jgi:Zn-dependent peptidase ImmA (M78 family)
MIIDGDNTLDTQNMLFRLDKSTSTQIEIEANNFAAALIMPASLVQKAWQKIGSVEECARIFHVSLSAMSIRLESLHLVDME